MACRHCRWLTTTNLNIGDMNLLSAWSAPPAVKAATMVVAAAALLATGMAIAFLVMPTPAPSAEVGDPNSDTPFASDQLACQAAMMSSDTVFADALCKKASSAFC